jgi:hypothetical protein
MLSFLDGEPFASGSQPYSYRPAIATDSSKRIIIEVEIQGRRTHAMLDTGAPYVICDPTIVKQLSLDPAAALNNIVLNIRGIPIPGAIHRLDLTLRAEHGDELIIDATAFVPNTKVDFWPGLPSIIGLEGCLERVRFAFDTTTDDETFYFGLCPE